MKNKKITLFIAALCFMLMLSACGVKSYSAEEYYEPYVIGLEGNGVFGMNVNSELKNQILNEALPKDATDLEEFQYELLLDTMEYEAEPSKNLSNGDKVKVTVKCDEKALSSIKVKFTNTEFTYTVEGLDTPEKLDVWSDVKITYEGIAPNGKAEIEYIGSNEFIKNNVRYSADKTSSLSNGDEITVTVSCSQTSLDSNLYYIPDNEYEKKYIVEGLGEYLSEATDFSELDKLFDDNVKNTVN